ncbi:phosphoenolpyruvate--protein phosphotransferase [Paludibacterium purpuratum]|uniref:phosphoenolpyruvate--protein phosphotransferase n=1 Tax=Paludibacterium purpuratum TaxID=1144873 RepID=A0A4R7B3L7_9NEIS|nr:phosphoenolpyruvate--protein phosphotransferase [Paludibacterium purpuratum]TDR76613.1 phosphocarrier protein HPr /phosphoenolpyruvate--protein phosphotransferase /PTS system D-fructose-specific IIA component (F1P-forming) (Frc family) [Paludibacterium purpuratum]
MSVSTLRRELVKLGSKPIDKSEAISEAGHLLAASGVIAPAYIDSMMRRENVSNTFLGHGVAIPHGMIEDRHLIHKTGIAVIQIPQGLEWNDGETVHLMVAIAAQSDEHITLLQRLTRLMQDPAQLAQLFATTDPDYLCAIFNGDAPPAAAPAVPATDLEQSFEWHIDYPNGLHARPTAKWVETAKRFDAKIQIRHGGDIADAKKLVALLQLGLQCGDLLAVSASGPQADAALTALRDTMIRVSAQELADAAAAKIKAEQAVHHGFAPSTAQLAIKGIGASPGLVVGTTQTWKSAIASIQDIPAPLAEGSEQLDNALIGTRKALAQLAEDTARRLGETEAGIFRAQAELLADTDLISHCCRLMMQGHGVAWSWHQAIEQQANTLAAHSNPLLATRATDLRDVGQRVLIALLPQEKRQPEAGQQASNLILLAADLAPSDTATLDTSRILGLCTAQGGPTSHTAILARTLGLPALVAGGDAILDIPDGTPAILDGNSGRLYLHPGEQDIDAARTWINRQSEQSRQDEAQSALPAQTRDGLRIDIGANINRADQVAAALAAGAEGVGLMRTEFLFLERDTAPDEEEQYQAYRAMVEALQGRTLVIRALDIGGDKHVPYLGLPSEANPFLGVRGVRLLLRRPDLLDTQLRALYRAAAHGPISLMFPMVTNISELMALRAECERIRQELSAAPMPIGIMIEVPAAAAMADQFGAHADFFSIGTNDLTQYTLAIDRQHPDLAAEADSLHPAVLRLIKQTVEGARKHGIWVGVCGGLAGDPLGAAILAGLGVNELSLSPRDIPAVKARLRASTQSALVDLAQQALECDSTAAIRALAGDAS